MGKPVLRPTIYWLTGKIKDDLLAAMVKEIKLAYGEDAETSESGGRIAHQAF